MGGATSLGDTSLEPKKKKKPAIGVGPPDLPSPRKKVLIYAFTALTEVSFLPEENVEQEDVDRISDLEWVVRSIGGYDCIGVYARIPRPLFHCYGS
jgi:hypothetical protein